jgi:hypothetical protein
MKSVSITNKYTGWLICNVGEPGIGGGGLTNGDVPPFPVGEGQPENARVRNKTAQAKIIAFRI